MTTKRVVADDLYGKFCRRIWELQRRVLERTIPVHDALDALQGILENSSSEVIPASLKPTLNEALSRIESKLSENQTFHHLKVGRYYFTKHHCGKRSLQVKVYYLDLKPGSKIYRGEDEILCTVCWEHTSDVSGDI